MHARLLDRPAPDSGSPSPPLPAPSLVDRPAAPPPAALDREAFTLLASASLRAVYAGALAVVSRRSDAEDVAQEALLAAYEKRASCRDPARFRAWLLQIVRNRALNFLERRRLRDVPGTEAAAPVEWELPLLPDVGLRERLRAAMAHLSATQRAVVLLHDTEGWTHEEIAARLGTSVLMSRKHLFQARVRLRALLDSDRPALGELPQPLSAAPPEAPGRAASAPPALRAAGTTAKACGNAARGSLVLHQQRSAAAPARPLRRKAAAG